MGTRCAGAIPEGRSIIRLRETILDQKAEIHRLKAAIGNKDKEIHHGQNEDATIFRPGMTDK